MVPGQSIQAAIDTAAPGDTVFVAAGTYTESLNLKPGIHVKGAGSSVVTLLSSGEVGVMISNCPGTEFSGFRLGRAPGAPLPTSPVGAAISIWSGSPVVKNNFIAGFPNRAIAIGGDATAIICGNRIVNNGGPANPNLDYAISADSAYGIISNNLIAGNEAGCRIGGFTGIQFVNNTVVNNSHMGLRCEGAATNVRNNVITGNDTGVQVVSGPVSTAVNPVLSYNDIWGNRVDDLSGGLPLPVTAGTGALAVDPLFDPAFPGDFFLAATSPCRNAGNPAALDNDMDGTRNDMGWRGGACGAAGSSSAPFGGFLFTSVGNIPANYVGMDGLANVPNADAGALRIPAWKNAPFAAEPWLYGVFGSGVNPHYYSVECKGPGDTDFRLLDHPLSKVKYTVEGSSITASLQAIGPFTVAGKSLYLSTVNGGGTYWAHDNLRLVLNTLALTGDGDYEFRVNGFNAAGDPVTLTNPAHRLRMKINNKRPVVTIHSITKAGAAAPLDECAIVGLDSPSTNLKFKITASHADGFLHSYALTAGSGHGVSAGSIASDAYDPAHLASPLWTGVSGENFDTSAAMTAGRLSPWRTCAYTFTLGAWSRATNGFGHVYYASDTWSLALNLGGADLDGDGDVDGDDLNIFAAAYGRAVTP